jgi:hypothetical protein
MKKFALVLLATAGVALSVPASADGVYVGAGPVGVGVSDGHNYYGGPGYREADRVEHTRTYVHADDYASARHCRVKIIRHGDHVTRVRRCD